MELIVRFELTILKSITKYLKAPIHIRVGDCIIFNDPNQITNSLGTSYGVTRFIVIDTCYNGKNDVAFVKLTDFIEDFHHCNKAWIF